MTVSASPITDHVKSILANYGSDNPGTKGNLARLLLHGRLGGSGKLLILPVDQGFEHGPARSFAPIPPLTIRSTISNWRSMPDCPPMRRRWACWKPEPTVSPALIPTILKVNSANSLSREKQGATQAVTAGVSDALRLGCSAIGFTIYPGSDSAYSMFEELRDLAEEAKAYGLAVVVWSYPRGGDLSTKGETAMDVIAYGAHMAALLGAHIIKVKLPTAEIEQDAARKVYDKYKVPIGTFAQRIAHVVQSCFDGRRIVIFSGGATTEDDAALYDDIRAIRDGGGFGSIIGRNTFQRPRDKALTMLDAIIDIYLGKR